MEHFLINNMYEKQSDLMAGIIIFNSHALKFRSSKEIQINLVETKRNIDSAFRNVETRWSQVFYTCKIRCILQVSFWMLAETYKSV